MPGAAHETIVSVIRSHPEWLDALLQARGQPGLPAGMTVADTAMRVVDPIEVRPDVLFVRGAKKGPWVIVEPQRDDDDGKQRRWLLAASALFNERGVMGDVLVVTHSRATAKWAREVAVVAGPMGTTLALVPIVVLLTRAFAEQLLATGRPELAVFAAWAVHHQRGARAVKVVEQAIETVQRVTGRDLQEAMFRAIVSMFPGERGRRYEKMILDFYNLPETPMEKERRLKYEAVAEARAKAREAAVEAHAKAEALLTVLAARSITVDDEIRARILACTDTKALKRWVARAANATTLAEVIGNTPVPPLPKAHPTRRKSTR